MTNYLAFDIEIARDLNRIPLNEFKPDEWEAVEVFWKDGWVQANYEGKYDHFLDANGGIIKSGIWHPLGNLDWKRFRPLGITCAAALSSDGRQWIWYGKGLNGEIAPRMTRNEVCQIVNTLTSLDGDGYKILTWNGLGFDFDILAEESQLPNACKTLALEHHVDMMFQFFCNKGYGLGLDAASKGMGLPGKPEGMDGAKAPELWPTDPLRVMHYCMMDCKNTLDLALAVEAVGGLSWTARSGRPNSWRCDEWLTTKACLDIPEPNTDWMTDPWPREKFTGWLGNWEK